MLHANELSLRHLDGHTTGPSEYSGPIGKLLKKCEQLPIVAFDNIKSDIPTLTIDVKELSADQNYMFEICQAVISGHCEISLSKRNPGKLSHGS